MTETRLVLGLARREARERARSRAFRVSTAILLLAAVAAVVLPAVFGLGDTEPYRIGVVGSPPAGLEAAIAGSAAGTPVELRSFEGRAAGEAALSADESSVDVLLDDRTLVWPQEPDPQLEAVLRSALTRLAIVERAEAAGLEQDEVRELLAGAEVSSISLDAPAEEGVASAAEPERRGPQALIATVGMVVLFVSITFYGSYILMSVVEEKQNRVVEVLLAHVRPRDLLAAKVLGHGALGLAQVLAIALIAAVGLAVTDPVDLPRTAYWSIAGVVMWFVLGYAFYSILYGALGSLASSTEDAQSAVGPLTILLMTAYFTTFAVINNPEGLLAVIGSFLPPTAPMMMPIRTALTDVPAWQPVTAIIIEIGAIIGLVRLGGRLYHGAVLQIGPKLGLRDAWRATT